MLRHQRVRDIATGLAAVSALLTIVVGVPAALATLIGWPLPDTVPDPGTVGAALRYGQIAPSTMLKALALVVWFAWALMTTGIVVELVAVVRGTVARALPTVGGLQHVAGRLLTAAMLLSTMTPRPAVAATPAPAALTADIAAPRPAAGHDEPAASDEDEPTYVVQRRDSLWTIAERRLDDGHRWREIRDLNVGRAQPGGGRLRAGDTMIHPGWVLRLPPDANRPQRAERIEVEHGDHLWGLAQTHLGGGDRWRQLYEHNAGTPQPDGRRLTRPDVIEPGWVLELPDQPEMPPGQHRLDGEAHGDPGPAHGDTGRTQVRDRGHDGDGSDVDDQGGTPLARDGDRRPGARRPQPFVAPVAPVPVTPSTLPDTPVDAGATAETTVRSAPAHPSEAAPSRAPGGTRSTEPEHGTLPIAGIALLAAALVGVIAQRRRRWLRHRQPGSALGPVDPEAAEVERWLRAMADHDLSHRADRVLRVLTDLFEAHDLHPPVVAFELGERVALLLSRGDVVAPPGVAATDDGRTWVLDAELEVAAPSADDRPPYIPALVSCGRRPTGEIVALNLLHLGVLGVDGSPGQVRQVLTSWTAELASRGAADSVEIIVVGPHHDLVEQFARVTVADDDRAASAAIDRALGTASFGGTAEHVVVLSAAAATGAARDVLQRRADADPRVAAVLAGHSQAGQRLLVTDEHVRLEPYGLELLAAEWLTPDSWDRFGDLLRQPVRQQQSDLVPSPLLTRPLDGRPGDLAMLGDDEPAPAVAVLGPLEVDGFVTPPAHAGELLALLAVHRDGLPSGTLAAHLGITTRQVTAAAEALGDDPDGRALLTMTDDGHHRLGAAVDCDLQRFHRLIRRTDHSTPAGAADALQQALALVRGVPFCDAGAWAHIEGLATTTAALVSDVAHRLATLVMTFGDLDRAAWAVEQGLLANPGCELLYRDRMRIADARGDHAALDAVMDDLRARAATDEGWVTPETLQLYERLKRAATIAAAPVDDHDGRRHAS